MMHNKPLLQKNDDKHGIGTSHLYQDNIGQGSTEKRKTLKRPLIKTKKEPQKGNYWKDFADSLDGSDNPQGLPLHRALSILFSIIQCTHPIGIMHENRMIFLIILPHLHSEPAPNQTINP